MRKIAYVGLSALAIVGTMTSQAWAFGHHIAKNVPNVGALTPNIGNLTPNIGTLTPNVKPGTFVPQIKPGAVPPNLTTVTPPKQIPKVRSPNFGQLPAKPPIQNAANAPLAVVDPPKLTPQAGPRLNYGILQPEPPNAAIGKLPPSYDKVPPQPPVNYGNLPPNPVTYGVLPPDAAAALPPRQPPNPVHGKLPDRPLPIAYGELPSAPTVPKKIEPAEELGRLIDIPPDDPRIANAMKPRVTENVGVPNPPTRTPVANVRPLEPRVPNVANLPPPPANVANLPPPPPPLANVAKLPPPPPPLANVAKLPPPLANVANLPPPKPLRNLQNLPPPRSLAAAPPPAAPKKLSTAQKRVIVGTGAVVGTSVTLLAVGISMPAIIEAITGEEIADTGDPTLDRAIDDLTTDKNLN